MTKKLRSPIWWFGGKGNLVPKLLEYIPQHTYYCEVFGGGASLLFAKNPVQFEVYNDVDSGLVTLFKVLRNPEKFKQFYKKVCLTPYSREEYYYCKETWKGCKDEIEKAYRFYVTTRMAFSGDLKGSWSHGLKSISRNMSAAVSKWLSTIEMLPRIHQRIMSVQIEHLDWQTCVEKYNEWEKDGFFYCDPPYLPETRRSGKYEHEMTYEDHEKLIDWLLTKCRVNVMLSGYDNKLYEKLETNGWQKVCWDVGCFAAGRTQQTGVLGTGSTYTKNQRRIECIWMNYHIPQHLFDLEG